MSSNIPNRGPELLRANIGFLIAAFIAYTLRCYVRVKMVKAFKKDDWLMGISFIFFLLYCISSNMGVHYGTGRHRYDLSPSGVKNARQAWYFCYLTYCASTICSKISIGYFLLRIAVRRLHTHVIYAAMAVTIVSGAAFFFAALFQCHPVSFFWNKFDKKHQGGCIANDIVIALVYVYSAFNILSDFTFALLPTFLVVNLRLEWKMKIALIPLLTMGCMASAAVVARLPYLPKLGSPDFLWETLDIAIWSSIEQGLAITAGSLATIRPLFSLVLHRLSVASYHTKQPTELEGFSPHRSGFSREFLDGYKLSSHSVRKVESLYGDAVVDIEKGAQATFNHQSWYKVHSIKVRRGSKVEGKIEDISFPADIFRENSSEKVLRKGSPALIQEEGSGGQIMVSKSFNVKQELRASWNGLTGGS